MTKGAVKPFYLTPHDAVDLIDALEDAQLQHASPGLMALRDSLYDTLSDTTYYEGKDKQFKFLIEFVE